MSSLTAIFQKNTPSILWTRFSLNLTGDSVWKGRRRAEDHSHDNKRSEAEYPDIRSMTLSKEIALTRGKTLYTGMFTN